MSCYMVNKRHIDLLVSAARRPGSHSVIWHFTDGREYADLTDQERQASYRDGRQVAPNDIGQVLVNENLRSVMYRYSDCTPFSDNVPGPCDSYWLQDYRFRPVMYVPTPADLIQACGGYNYQACEHPEYEKSEAKAIVTAIREQAIRRVTTDVEGFWDWDGEQEDATHVNLIEITASANRRTQTRLL